MQLFILVILLAFLILTLILIHFIFISSHCLLGSGRSREVITQKEIYFPKRDRSDPTYLPMFDILITSYDVVCKDKNALARIGWNFLVVDETQKSPQIGMSTPLVTISSSSSII